MSYSYLTLTSWNPLGHSRPVTGLICLYLYFLFPELITSLQVYQNILLIKPTRCTISQLNFDKELYMFRTDLLSNIRSLNTVFTAIGICPTI